MKISSQNLSIMMTDIQGYTDASSAASRSDIIALLRNHSRLMVPVFRFYNGTIIKTIGDAFLVTFTSATDAAVCAIVIQLMLQEYNRRQRDETKRLKLRVVINTGDVTVENNDIFGEAVNVTARMEGLPCFPGGTIGISESTWLLMNRNEIVADLIGPQTLKGIPLPVTVYQIPLEKQKLNQIPTRLLELVEHVVNNVSTDDREFSERISHLFGTPGPEGDRAEPAPAMTAGPTPPAPVPGTGKSVPAAPSRPSPPVAGPAAPAPRPAEASWKMRLQTLVLDVFILVVAIRILRVPPQKAFWFITFYLTLFWRFRGASLGQAMYGLHVLTLEGSRPGFFRCLSRAVLFIPSLFFLFIKFFGKQQFFHDLVTNTSVFLAPGAGQGPGSPA